MNVLSVFRIFLSTYDRLFVLFLGLASFCISLLETFCLSAVMPFLMMVLDQQRIKELAIFRFLEGYLSITENSKVIFIVGIGLLVLFMVRAFATTVFTYVLNQFAQQKSHEIAQKTFQNYLQSSYQEYSSWNSAAVLKMVSTDPFHVGVVISSALQAATEIGVMITIYSMLLWSNWKTTVGGTVVLAVTGLLLVPRMLSIVSSYGTKNGYYLRQITQTFNESFGNFKIIRVTQVEHLFLERFGVASYGFSQTQAHYFTLQTLPRLFLETCMVIVLVVFGLMLSGSGQNSSFGAISELSLYAIAFYRVIPALNRLLSYYGQIKFSLSLIGGFDHVLMMRHGNKHEFAAPAVRFDHEISMNNVSFAYGAGKPVFTSLCLAIAKGERVGIIGKSGSGKTTLIDILLGLQLPSQGELTVDGIALDTHMLPRWQKLIGYIPQHIYLFEGSVADNVVFGRPYDQEHLIACLKKAQIYDLLLSKNGLETQVGEGGAQLSGGQRQRIALARAFYGNPSILILDEATSALDQETESLVFQDLFTMTAGITMIIVTHRTQMLSRCDRVYEMNEGILTPVLRSSYQEKNSNQRIL